MNLSTVDYSTLSDRLGTYWFRVGAIRVNKSVAKEVKDWTYFSTVINGTEENAVSEAKLHIDTLKLYYEDDIIVLLEEQYIDIDNNVITSNTERF